MNTGELQQNAAETVKRAGITGERGLAVQEGMASSGANKFEDTAGDLIPGASMLASRARRTVLVTDHRIRLFKGRPHKPGTLLGTYEREPGVLWFDGDKLTFPDEQVVYMTSYQARVLASAGGVECRETLNERVLEKAGLRRDGPALIERGSSAKKTRRGSRVWRSEIVGELLGDLDLRDDREGRIVVVTLRDVYLLDGHQLPRPGPPIGTYQVGDTGFSRDGESIVFPDGEVVAFNGPATTQRVGDAVLGILSNADWTLR